MADQDSWCIPPPRLVSVMAVAFSGREEAVVVATAVLLQVENKESINTIREILN